MKFQQSKQKLLQLYNHFILTRFNLNFQWKGVKTKNWLGKTTDASKVKLCSSEWLDNRFKLFDDFCFPSIRSQTNQNFIWLVGFSNNTPDKYKSKIIEYSQYNNFVPVYHPETFCMKTDKCKYFITEIKKRIKPNCDFIVTTRIDNDDAFSINAINEIQKYINNEGSYIIDFPFGYGVDNNNFYEVKWFNSPFLTLREDLNVSNLNLNSVLGFFHSDINLINKYQIKYIIDKKIWLQTYHKHNLINHKIMKKRAKKIDYIPDFKILFPEIQNNSIGLY